MCMTLKSLLEHANYLHVLVNALVNALGTTPANAPVNALGNAPFGALANAT